MKIRRIGRDVLVTEPDTAHVHDWRVYRLVHEARGDFYECEGCGERQFRASRNVGV